MSDYCKGCGARPGDGFVGGHRAGCRQIIETVCGVKMPAGGICARPAKECNEHDTLRAMTSLWLGCGFVNSSGVGDTLCEMAERTRKRTEELIKIIHRQQGDREAILTVLDVAGDVAKGRDPIEACREVVAVSNERCDLLLKAEADRDAYLRERNDARIQRDNVQRELDKRHADATELSVKLAAIVRTMCELGMGSRPVEVDVAELASEFKSNTERMHNAEQEARALRLRCETTDAQRDELLQHLDEMKLEVEAKREQFHAGSRHVEQLRAELEQVRRERDELAEEMAHGVETGRVIEALQNAGAPNEAGLALPCGEMPLKRGDAMLDAIAFATADRLFEWITGGA